MTTRKIFELNARTKAGTVRGTLSVSLEGPPDGLAAVERALTAHLLAAPCDLTQPEEIGTGLYRLADGEIVGNEPEPLQY